MKKVNTQINATNTTIKQFTPVYHLELGRGHVVSVTYRKDNNLIMCYFPSTRTHEWIGETTLRSGVGDITLTKQTPKAQRDEVGDSLQAALESLFSPR